METKTPKEDARLHWNYIKQLLQLQGIDKKGLGLMGFLYISSFIHGAKHQASGTYDETD